MPTRDTAPGAKQSACSPPSPALEALLDSPPSPALEALLDALISQNQMFSKFNALGAAGRQVVELAVEEVYGGGVGEGVGEEHAVVGIDNLARDVQARAIVV